MVIHGRVNIICVFVCTILEEVNVWKHARTLSVYFVVTQRVKLLSVDNTFLTFKIMTMYGCPPISDCKIVQSSNIYIRRYQMI